MFKPDKKGNIICSDKKLESLEGAPQKVEGSFDCFNNNLTSLKGVPEIIKGSFSCIGNELTSLEGCPKEVWRNFYCYSPLEAEKENLIADLKDAQKAINYLDKEKHRGES